MISHPLALPSGLESVKVSSMRIRNNPSRSSSFLHLSSSIIFEMAAAAMDRPFTSVL